MDEKYYAFWKYDSVPYLLGGEVIEFRPDGQVSVKGYTGTLFKPVKVVPLSKGIKLKNELERAEAVYREKHRSILAELNMTVRKICE